MLVYIIMVTIVPTSEVLASEAVGPIVGSVGRIMLGILLGGIVGSLVASVIGCKVGSIVGCKVGTQKISQHTSLQQGDNLTSSFGII